MEHVSQAPLSRQLGRLSRRQLADRLQAIRTLSAIRGLRLLDDGGRPKTIDLATIPWILTAEQLAFFRRLVLHVVDALVRLPALYRRDPRIREILCVEPDQEAWFDLATHPAGRPLAVLGRLDSTATYGHADWRRRFAFLEPNAVGVGGVYYAPAACSVILDVLGDVLERAYPGRRIVPTPDPRRLLVDELRHVARRIKRPLRRLALIENTDYTTGTDEFGSLARDLTRQGLPTIVADPRDLHLRNGRLVAQGGEVDLLYRDCELSEFLEIEAAGHRLTGLRQAIREGRLVSGLLWEFDQKSAWEIFTDPAFFPYFTPAQRALFRAYLPWTRLVREATVHDPGGRLVDLPAYIRRRKDRLVLKPNMLYGGQGVVIGCQTAQSAWDRTLSRALRGATRYVVQGLSDIHAERFPVLEDGRPRDVERSVVSGFFFNSAEIGLVGRFSSQSVVNVSRGGGLLAALMVQPNS